MLKLWFSCFLLCYAWSQPPKEVPVDLLSKYTLEGRIPVRYWYFDGSYSEPIFYSKEQISLFIKKIQMGETGYYRKTDNYLYQAISDNIESFKGKRVGIIGSFSPWYESVVLYYEGIPVTIEYNKITTDDDRLNLFTVDEYKKNPETFDVILSISSFEHDGLGRYGDLLNPNGDLDAMKEVGKMLNPGGLLFLAVPIGQDSLIWNAHRLYGEIRFPMLIEGWDIEQSYGFKKSDLKRRRKLYKSSYHQPVFVLKSKS
ncbi:MAG: hypothetical protein S4CHLAM20_11260 [Chlamydiia bacterium]|nr:hypothetical protein [Chlamydiia bacterium]